MFVRVGCRRRKDHAENGVQIAANYFLKLFYRYFTRAHAIEYATIIVVRHFFSFLDTPAAPPQRLVTSQSFHQDWRAFPLESGWRACYGRCQQSTASLPPSVPEHPYG